MVYYLTSGVIYDAQRNTEHYIIGYIIQAMLRDKGVRQSMGRKGNRLNHAVIENFFGLLKSELLYLQEFDSMEHFKQHLIDYLDDYNNRRMKVK